MTVRPKHRLTRQQVAKLPVASPAELTLAVQLEQAGIPFEREYRFDPDRKFRADFMVRSAWKVRNSRGVMVEIDGPSLLIEVEGGAWVNGRHSRGAGMEADCEKSALAAIRGYRVMRLTPAQVNDGRGLAWVKQALGLAEAA